LFEKAAHFLIARLREIFVPETESVERLRSCGAHDFIDFISEFIAGLGRRYRYSNHYARRLLLFEGRNRSAHGGSGCQTVIDQDNRAAAYVQRRAVTTVCALTPVQFRLLCRRHRID
jgi:hypothetical protein